MKIAGPSLLSRKMGIPGIPTKGFSLVEMMVVILLLGILSVGGYPMMMEYAQESRLEQQARAIFDDLCLTRDAAVAAGTGNTTFQMIRNPVEPFVRFYEFRTPDGVDIRPVFMEQMVSGVGWRRDITEHAACILPRNVPAISPSVFELQFNGNGFLVNTPNMDFVVKFFNASAATYIDQVGTWVIEIPNDAQLPGSRPRLRREP